VGAAATAAATEVTEAMADATEETVAFTIAIAIGLGVMTGSGRLELVNEILETGGVSTKGGKDAKAIEKKLSIQ